MKPTTRSVSRGHFASCKALRGGLLREGGTATYAGLLFAVASALACGGKSVGEPSQGHAYDATGGHAPFDGATSMGGTTGSATKTSVVDGSGRGGAPSTVTFVGVGGGTVNTYVGTTAVLGVGGTTTSTLLSAGGTNTGSGTGTNRTALLESNSAWLDLKQLWQKLDAILPTTTTYSPYANTITTEQRDQYLVELNAALSGIQTVGLLSELELLFLRNIVTARVEVMKDGGYRYELYLHRAPGLFENATEKSVALLEQKIDTLEVLRDRCMLEPEAYRQALEQIEREATVFFVVEQLSQVPSGYNVNVAIPSDLWGESLATELDKRLAAQAVGPDVSEAQIANLGLLRSRLADIKSTIAGLPWLLQVLERCE